MFAAALRPASFAARAAFKPTRLAAVRAISSTAARRSDHPTPEIYGEGAKAGQIPTDVNQSTGLERLQILGALEGVEIFDLKPLDSSRLGTVADPVKVFSAVSTRHVFLGCNGISSLLLFVPCRSLSVSLAALVSPPSPTNSFG